jgi:hypothetical protein
MLNFNKIVFPYSIFKNLNNVYWPTSQNNFHQIWRRNLIFELNSVKR